MIEVSLEEHHHLHPVDAYEGPDGHEKVATITEVALDLRGNRLVPILLLRDGCGGV